VQSLESVPLLEDASFIKALARKLEALACNLLRIIKEFSGPTFNGFE
jgi:hypothetical protein